ncbi:MAG: leucine-rich repeat protein [Ruminococcus sp.]|nr:leucine-rich repeat protein [Ruminococcus sp.]
MKKLCFLLALVLLSSFITVPVEAAHSDFDVQSGILVKYNGTGAEVTVPDYVTAIGASAFENNINIRVITLNANVYSIGERAFYGCSSLESVRSGDGIVEIGDMAFRGTPYLEMSTDKYMMLGKVLLWYNGTSPSVTIPSRCTSVASYAFARCDYLQSFTAYEGLISVGTGAFYGCSSLESVNLPSTVSEIGAYAFDDTPYLRSAGEFASAGDGILIRYQGSESDVMIPDTIRRIAPHAFVSSKVTSVNIPDSVYAIDRYAFADCVGLKTLDLNNGLISIGDGAFRGCKSLREFIAPTSLSYIGQQAFCGDSAIGSASVRGNDLSVSYHAFQDCTGLKYVLLSDGVCAIYDNAFDGCTALEGISIPADVSRIGTSALSGCDKAVVCCNQDSPAYSVLSSHEISTVIGDVDSDGSLNIIDATGIQMFIANLRTLNGAQTAAADMNSDGEINIVDAVKAQMKIAQLE